MSRPPSPERGERGAALLVVMVAVAILTALAVQLAYDTRVELQLAGNARDKLRAEYLARSGVAMSRLVLAFQAQLDQASGAAQAAASNALRAAGGPAAAAAATGAFPSLRLWSAVPVNSGLVQAMFGGAGAPGEEASSGPTDAPRPARFGDFEGLFSADVEDEFSKVDAQLGDWLALSSRRLRPQVLAIWQLVCDPRWDPLFDREDANGIRVSRQDLLVHLRDWADEDTQSSALVAAFGGAPCAIDPAQNPFEPGFGDENMPYDRGEDRYKAKNARLDSLDELYLVAGVSDAFMAAFGDRLTVYVPNDAKQTVDPRSLASLLLAARLVADPPVQTIFYDQKFPALLQRAALDQTMGGRLNLTGAQFVELVKALGVTVGTQNPLGDRSTVFRIRATGAAGDVEAHVDAVVSMDGSQGQGQAPNPQGNPNPNPNQTQVRNQSRTPFQPQLGGAAQPGQNLGRLVRWREE